MTLRLCRLPMKSHSKASPQRSCLAARSCWRFSPTSRTPASASAPISSSGTYLVAARISTPSPATARGPAPGWRRSWPASRPWISSGHLSRSPRARRAAWRPVRPRVAAVGEEELRLAARAEAGGLDPLDPGRGEQPPRRPRRRSSMRPAAIPRRGRRRRRAPRRRPRSSRGRSRARSRRRSRRPPRRRGRRSRPASPRQPQCSIATPPGPASATGRQSATKTSGASAAARATTWPSTSGISRRPGSAKGLGRCGPAWIDELGAVDLAADQRPARARGRARRRAGGGSRPPRRASSSVRMPRLRLSKGGSLTPPSRVEKAARAPRQLGLEPARRRRCSRHSIALRLARRRERRRRAPRSRPAISPSSLRRSAAAQAAADRRALGTPAAIRSSPSISSSTSRHSVR